VCASDYDILSLVSLLWLDLPSLVVRGPRPALALDAVSILATPTTPTLVVWQPCVVSLAVAADSDSYTYDNAMLR
jgi:hypothetical protein